MPDESVSGWHHEVLTAAQRLALGATGTVFSACPGSFLAGGTALALRFGHRRSRDLDWFTSGPFDHLALAQDLARLVDARVVHAEPGTLRISLHPGDSPMRFSSRRARRVRVFSRARRKQFVSDAALGGHSDLRLSDCWLQDHCRRRAFPRGRLEL